MVGKTNNSVIKKKNYKIATDPMAQGKAKLIKPNLTNRQWQVALVNTVYVGDIKKYAHGIINSDGTTRPAYLLVFSDCASGKIVAYCFEQTMNAKIATDCLRKRLQKLSKKRKHRLIVHTDRGAEFVSHVFDNLMVEFPFLNLSMSACAKPIDNGVAESLWSSMGKLKTIWQMAGYQEKPSSFSSLKEGQEAIASFFEHYNQSHAGLRSMKETANFSEEALLKAELNEEQVPLVLFVPNKPTTQPVALAKQNIQLFKKKAMADHHLALQLSKARPSLGEVERIYQMLATIKQEMENLNQGVMAVSQNQVVFAQGMSEKLDSNQANLEAKLEAIQKSIGNGATQKNKIKHAPRRLRSGLDLDTTYGLFGLWETADILTLRSILAIVTLRALGCRVSELQCFTFEQFDQLLLSGYTEIMNFKLNRKEVKVVSAQFALQISCILKQLRKFLCAVFNLPNDGLSGKFFVFTSYESPFSPSLQTNYFTANLNSFLEKVACEYNLKNGTLISFKTHSGRIGFVTNAFQNEVDVAIIQKMVGHKDIRSTMLYDRSSLSVAKKRSLLDQIDGDLFKAPKLTKN